eukprot:TRINITY_DN16049_c0_g1_i2.p1 TRINITY_DN16049_c0_g1~~TRINITY_DN16049_c0_g1_i2.p1  ORF type:complete len:459 (-),score=113.66 TRINITY_DN16049_c0_g1_i2:60-1436(-)
MDNIVSVCEEDGEVHALEHAWSFYFDEKGKGTLEKLTASSRGSNDGEKESPCSPGNGSGGNSILIVGSFATVQEFWCYWNNLEISKLPDNSNIRILKSNLSPSMEDVSSGGKWIVPCEKDQLEQKWLLLVLSLIGGHFDDEISGTLLSIGRRLSTITLWSRSTDKQILSKSETYLTDLLSIPKDKIRFQRQNGSELKGKTFSIKLTRSNLSTPISLPSLDGISPLRLSLGSSEEESTSSPVASPSRFHPKPRGEPTASPTKASPVASVSPAPVSIVFTPPTPDTPPSKPTPPSHLCTPRNLASSMEAASPRHTYSLPKFYRRRGRTSRSPSSSPLQQLSLEMDTERQEEESPSEREGEESPDENPLEAAQLIVQERSQEVEVVSSKPVLLKPLPRDFKKGSVTRTKTVTRSISTSIGPVAAVGSNSFSAIWMLLLGASAFLMIVVVFSVIPSLQTKES